MAEICQYHKVDAVHKAWRPESRASKSRGYCTVDRFRGAVGEIFLRLDLNYISKTKLWDSLTHGTGIKSI